MEIEGSLSKGSLYLIEESGSLLDDRGAQVKDSGLELAEMLTQEGVVDREDRSLLRETDGGNPEVTLQTWVHEEGTSSGVHTGNEEGVLDLLKGQLCLVIPMVVVLELSNESNSTLCVIGIKSWHVEIINEVDQLILADWSKVPSSLLFEGCEEDVLE